MKVSVIVPVYKVETFIERCARSLFEQTLEDDVEFIFVDDGTPDGSMDVLRKVLADYPHRQDQTHILSHAVNRGLPAARNTGLAAAVGDYIFHCDSDDYVEPTLLERMYNAASQGNADMVWCDFFLSFEKNERYMHTPDYATADEALLGMLSGAMKYNVWNKMVRRDLYGKNGVLFPEGHGMGEDMTMIRLVACAERVGHVAEALYHYVKLNGEAFTNAPSERHLEDIRYNTDLTCRFLEEKKGTKADEWIALFKLSVKWPFLISDKREDYKRWTEWWPEANGCIRGSHSISTRNRIVQTAASKKQWWVVRLHYLCYKILYGTIYR